MVYAGLDLHKSFCHVLVCEKKGELIKEGRIKTETKDIAEFFYGLEDLTVAFEASSNYEYFYDLLEGLGHKVVLAHPLKTKMIAEAKIKTDKIDAKTLEELLRGGFFFAYLLCSTEGDKGVKAFSEAQNLPGQVSRNNKESDKDRTAEGEHKISGWCGYFRWKREEMAM